MAELERVAALARKLLTVPVAGSAGDTCLWLHSERVMRAAGYIAALPELGGARIDRTALAVAALFHDAGWIVQLRQGQVDRWRLLARPTNDIQRELGAALLREHVERLIPSGTLETAVAAIRQCNQRDASLAEARVLAEAENLDEVGVLFVLRQARAHLAEGRGVDQLLSGWRRQKEYQYWEARVRDSFRFESVKRLARARLAALERFMEALAIEHAGDDLRQLVESPGVDATGVPA